MHLLFTLVSDISLPDNCGNKITACSAFKSVKIVLTSNLILGMEIAL